MTTLSTNDFTSDQQRYLQVNPLMVLVVGLLQEILRRQQDETGIGLSRRLLPALLSGIVALAPAADDPLAYQVQYHAIRRALWLALFAQISRQADGADRPILNGDGRLALVEIETYDPLVNVSDARPAALSRLIAAVTWRADG